MHVITVNDDASVRALCEFLRKVHVQVVEVRGLEVCACVPGAPSDLHERRELVGYVVTWNALNPGREAILL